MRLSLNAIFGNTSLATREIRNVLATETRRNMPATETRRNVKAPWRTFRVSKITPVTRHSISTD